MAVQSVSNSLIEALVSSARLEKPAQSGSRTLDALKNLHSGEADSTRSRLALRMERLRSDLGGLRESQRKANTMQASLTILQTVRNAASDIESELEEMRRLAQTVEEGQLSESQLQDVQEMLESRMARIDSIASQAKFRGQELITGENVRIETDTRTGEGFDVYFEKADSASLGLDNIDVVNQASSDEAVGLIQSAMECLNESASDVDRRIASQETQLESEMGLLTGKLSEMQAHEKLSATSEDRWRTASAAEQLLNALQVGAVPALSRLEGKVVSALLR
jgi:flagellin-like hook-associated protein FlgL